LRAAYNFARWLVRNDHDAEDIVQESFAKAFRSLESFRGGNARVWLLTIVRNTAMNLLQRRQSETISTWNDMESEPMDTNLNPENALFEKMRRRRVRTAIEQLPDEFRDTLILRDLEELSYKEIAGILNIPLGTVMSRLARARNLLLQELMVGRRADEL